MLQVYLLFGILFVTLCLFIWGYWRYDVVALLALISSVLIGVVPVDKAFTGFANPAVITVLCVMVTTYAITESGILDHALKKITLITRHVLWHIAALTVVTACLSAFMNNVGALALMMPMAIQTSIKAKRSPSLVLMPLAFGSILGGLVTSIGTPPNLLIAAYREQITGQAFTMFDFSPVGLTIAVVGLAFIIFIGWRFLPERKAPGNAEELFQMQDYITEVKVTEESKVAGSSMRELDRLIEADFLVVGMIRKKKKHLAVSADEILQVNDVLIIEGDHQDLEKFISDGKLELVTGEVMDPSLLSSDKIALIEAVVPQGSRVEGRSSQSMRLRSRHHLNLVAIARQGNPFKNRLNHVNLRAGDVVMLQGNSESLKEDVLSLGFLPLIERGVQVGLPRKAFMPALIFLGAILLATFQVLPVQIAFATAVVVLIITNIVPVRKLYDTINWPVIILLGALIPVGQALNSSDATEIMTRFMQDLSLHISPVFMIALLFFVTMTLSDLMNNAATAVVMAPISVIMAQTLHAHVDPFLMTVAVAASCSFLTPIGHQNNTLVLGPGGYKFFDYLRMGIPLEIIIIIIAVPMILWIWPL